jgi:hypothetical protein
MGCSTERPFAMLRQERGKIDGTIKAPGVPMTTPPRPASRGIGTRRRRSVLSHPPCRLDSWGRTAGADATADIGSGVRSTDHR